jgi:hypothetical protein
MGVIMKQHEKLAMAFEDQHANPPPPFNPDYKPYAKQISMNATKYMAEQGYYDADYTREELAMMRKKVYNKLMKEFEEKL